MENKNFEMLIAPTLLKNGGYLRGAHHPHCDRHNHHLIWILGHPLCLGCTCMYSGIVMGIPITLLIPWHSISFTGWLLFHLVLLIPTLIQVFIQIKLYKIVARTVLGITVSSYFMSGLLFLIPPIDKIVFIFLMGIVFSIMYYALRAFRNRFTKNPCDNCPLGRFPVCEWNLPRLLDEMPDGKLREAIQQNQISDLMT